MKFACCACEICQATLFRFREAIQLHRETGQFLIKTGITFAAMTPYFLLKGEMVNHCYTRNLVFRRESKMKAALLAGVILASSVVIASQATGAVQHKGHRHYVRTCTDKVLCRKIDKLSLEVSKGLQTLNDTVTSGQTAEADFNSKSLALSQETLTSLKAVESQGAQAQHAILLTFDDRALSTDETPEAAATKVCTDAGFKTGKAVDVSRTHYVFRSNADYLRSAVCTY